MLTKAQFADGIMSFITAEMLPALDGWQFWAASVAVNLARSKADQILDQYINHPVLATLEIVDSNGLIDIEKVYDAFTQSKKEMQPVAIDLNSFGLGKFTFKPEDAETLYLYLQGHPAE